MASVDACEELDVARLALADALVVAPMPAATPTGEDDTAEPFTAGGGAGTGPPEPPLERGGDVAVVPGAALAPACTVVPAAACDVAAGDVPIGVVCAAVEADAVAPPEAVLAPEDGLDGGAELGVETCAPTDTDALAETAGAGEAEALGAGVALGGVL